MTGDDWNKYFQEKYGAGNVTWENPYGIDINNLKFTNTVLEHGDRGYQESKLLIKSIVESSVPKADPQGTNGLYWKVVGGNGFGSSGTYELLIDPETNTVLHFLYRSSK